MSRVAVCTAAAGNYLAFVRVLAESFRRLHPNIPFYLLLVDNPEPREPGREAGVRLVDLRDLRIPELWKMRLRYDRKQLLTATKPAMLRTMLDRGYETVLFLDPDVLVIDTLEPVLQVVASHSLTLTPHVGPAFAMARRTGLEKTLLFTGMFNGGFVGATNRQETRRFLAWWEGRLRTHCIEALPLGFHFDQRWLDLAPGFLADLHLLRDPGCNVAYWNLPELELRLTPKGMRVNGSPLRLFHFSGFNPATPDLVSRHLPGVSVEEICPLPELFDSYARLLYDAGWAETSKRPWPWDGWRRVYRKIAEQARRMRGRPLA